jgi:hypothetical protein
MSWKILSIVGIYSVGILGILEAFFAKYKPNYLPILQIILGLAGLLFMISELMRYINKARIKRGHGDE